MRISGKEKEMADILERVVFLLERAESFIVPVKWVWKRLEEESHKSEVTVEQLTERLRNDERFKIFEGLEFNLANDLKSLISREEMESMGLYQGPRIMLKSRIPSRKEVISLLMRKVDQTFEALKKAWDARPSDNDSMEDQLLEALAKAQRLQRELRTVLSQEEERKGKDCTLEKK